MKSKNNTSIIESFFNNNCLFIICTGGTCPNTHLETPEEQAQSEELEQLIVGEWVAKGALASSKVVYLQNGLFKGYYNNQVYRTYNWEIYTITTDTGLTLSRLVLKNTQNPNDKRTLHINAMNDERMVLVYMNGAGPQRNIYFRQP